MADTLDTIQSGINNIKDKIATEGVTDSTGKVLLAPTKTTTPPAVSKLENQNSTGLNTTGAGTGSVISTSNPVVADEKNTTQTVQNITQDNSNIDAAHQSYLSMLDTQRAQLEQQRQNELQGINASFDTEKTKLGEAQKNETGTFGATLSRIGGYLGDSASAAGALVNLNQQHTFQINDLQSKRQSAIQAAQQAIDDKEFDLAKAKAQEAKDYAKQIEDSKQTFFDNSIKVLQAQQNQQQAQRDAIKDKLTNLAYLTPDKIPEATKTEIDQFYGTPGFTDNYIKLTNQAAQAKSSKEVMDARKATIDFLQSIPAGQKVTMPDGTEFTGMGKAGDVATFLQTDSNGVGHLITYNKMTGAKSITNLGVVGKGNGGNTPVGPVEKDNAINIFQTSLEASKDKNGNYDPDKYLELRNQLKDSNHPQLLPEIDKLFLNKANGFFSDDAITRLRKKGVYYGDSALPDNPTFTQTPYNAADNNGDVQSDNQ